MRSERACLSLQSLGWGGHPPCCCYCRNASPVRKWKYSSSLVRQWISRGLGISVEQTRSWWKQLVNRLANNPAHTGRDGHPRRRAVTDSEGLGKAQLWAREGPPLSFHPLNSESQTIVEVSLARCLFYWVYLYTSSETVGLFEAKEMTCALRLFLPWSFLCKW